MASRKTTGVFGLKWLTDLIVRVTARSVQPVRHDLDELRKEVDQFRPTELDQLENQMVEQIEALVRKSEQGPKPS